MRNHLTAALVLLVCLVLSARAFAGGSLELTWGYDKLKCEGIDKNLDGAEGTGGQLRTQFSLLPAVADPLMVGVGVGYSYYNETGSGASASSPSESKLLIGNGEVFATWRQFIGPIFIEPKFGALFLVGRYESSEQSGITQAIGETSTGWAVRPGLRVGGKIAIVDVGAEVNYMRGNLKFDSGAGGRIEETYFGLFAGLAW